jgi:hypothetical protein
MKSVDILKNTIILTLENLKEFFYMKLMLELKLAKKQVLLDDSHKTRIFERTKFNS